MTARSKERNKEVTTMIRTIETHAAAHAAPLLTRPEDGRCAIEASGTG
jgi:hypothetical protein